MLLLVTAFWTVDSFTGEISQEWTLDNIITVLTGSLYQTVTLRTLGVALLVTLIDVVLALPIAFFMAKVATPRMQRILVIAVLTPLWASYLVKAYAWRSVLSQDGILEWLLAPFGGSTPGYGLPATIITLSYLWLPYVILPIYAGLERVPDSLLEASVRPRRTHLADPATGRASRSCCPRSSPARSSASRSRSATTSP